MADILFKSLEFQDVQPIYICLNNHNVFKSFKKVINLSKKLTFYGILGSEQNLKSELELKKITSCLKKTFNDQ